MSKNKKNAPVMKDFPGVCAYFTHLFRIFAHHSKKIAL